MVPVSLLQAGSTRLKVARGLKDVGKLARGFVEHVHSEYTKTFEEQNCELRNVATNVIAMEFPTEDKRYWLSTRVKKLHPGNYLVVNLSGQTYSTTEFEGQVLDIVLGAAMLPPLDVLVRLCVSVHKWLDADHANVAVVHCDSSYRNTSLFFCCLSSWMGNVLHPKEAWGICVERLGMAPIPPAVDRYLGYFELVRGGFVTSSASVRLGRIVVTASRVRCVPQDLGPKGTRPPILEVWQDAPPRLTFASAFEGFGSVAEDAVFGFIVNIEVIGDIVIRARAFEESGPEYFSVAFHTGFIDMPQGGGCLRLGSRDLDMTGGESDIEGACVDVLFEELGRPGAGNGRPQRGGVPLDPEAQKLEQERLQEARRSQALFCTTALHLQCSEFDALCADVLEQHTLREPTGARHSGQPKTSASNIGTVASSGPVDGAIAVSDGAGTTSTGTAGWLVSTPDDIEGFFAELDAIADL